MKKFLFSLEPLLKIRQNKENEEYRNLSKIVSKINRIREEINEIEQEMEMERKILSQKIQTQSSIQDYAFFFQVTQSLELKIHELEKEIQNLEPEWELAKLRLTQARKEKRVIEILKEKAYQEYKKKLKKEEKKELYEFIITRKLQESSSAIPQEETKDWDFWELPSFEEESIWDYDNEVAIEEKPLTEMEKLQKYYDETIKKQFE